MDAVTVVPQPGNEPVLGYPPGSAEHAGLAAALTDLSGSRIEVPAVIGGRSVHGGGSRGEVVQPHARRLVLADYAQSTQADTQAALAAARAAAPGWRELSFDDRAAVFLKAAELLAGPWRPVLNAATMLGQSKTIQQAEIDSACELIDFWRFNVHFARQLLAEQPVLSGPGVWNRTDHRPLEGFVYAVTPFNFTAIAANLPTAPALLGNVVIWKPAPGQLFSAHFTMQLLAAAGLPPGVINMLPGDGLAVSEVVLTAPDLAGIHFTGSTATFKTLWREVAANLDGYRSYPRLVGETGGKDFVLAHPSADLDVLRMALVRGAFEYQGQKCSAASRAYLPRSVWHRLRDDLVDSVQALPMGPVTEPSNVIGAVIDERAFAKQVAAIERARDTASVSVLAGGQCDDGEGWFVRPTVLLGEDPNDEAFRTEYFGPILAVHVFPDHEFESIVRHIDETSRYALTGAVIARDRGVIAAATRGLRFAAGNFYVNDKPTGAVVGQQPFGGGRASGTNDKAGSRENLQRWTSSRSIKETFDAAGLS